ncbi:MAG: ATPase [Treponema sp.]|nr:ATPase [Treponema sp.]
MAIVQMKKVSLVVLNSQRKESLKKLRKMGLLHLETVQGKGPILASYKENSSAADKAISIIDEIKLPKKQLPVQVKLSKEGAIEKAKEIVSLNDKKKSMLDKISQDIIELERLSSWGSVDPEDFAYLAEKRIFLYMFEIPLDKYSLVGKESKTILVNSVNKTARFLLLSETEVNERPADLPPEAYSVPVPDRSTEQIAADIAESKARIAQIESELTEDKKYRAVLADLKNSLATDIEFENLYSGMERDESENAQDAKDSAEPMTVEDALALAKAEEEEGGSRLAWVTGYVPVDSLDKFESECRANEWAYAMADPAEEDFVPTKLHNNKLVSLIYPLTDFLDVTPGYHEYDISGWFLMFFCIFFAMIFADAGYGLLIALLGLLLYFKSKKGSKSLPVLVILLGACTTLWGTLTCSLFGISADRLPSWFTALSSSSPFAANTVGEDASNTNQKVFCFVLALIQLSIAHIKGIVSNRKSLKAIGELGSLMQLWGMFYVVMNMVVDSNKFPLSDTGIPIRAFGFTFPSNLPIICIGVLLFGFALSFVFSNYDGSIGKSVLESCKNIISVLLGIVNVFSDIVSYIRLWAVALAGAAISSTVNSMAGPMFGKLALVIFAVVLLVFGHGLNMMLNLLSVIVHGVRLNTLEFSTHLGMTWSGTKYRPFSEGAKPFGEE